ncbi:HAMP domain-containing sensor histidine kinase [Flavobacterium sp.]|uniref:sensor histidine kinase n=1 Tax=Flavobacterium sp. TaxID=239 RepID=UPI0025C18D47|nr:HAMP domain-containing sensor histidine kinase [Flavobacterium sp.]
MTRKLLHKTSFYYLAYFCAIMAAASVLFYFVADALLMDDAEDELLHLKQDFIVNSGKSLRDAEIADWNRYNSDRKISEIDANFSKDTLFYQQFYNIAQKENEPYRVLQTRVSIDGKDYLLSVKSNIIEREDLIVSLVGLFVVVLGLILIGQLILTRNLSLRLWQPFYQTLAAIERFEIDKKNFPALGRNSIEEFTRLNAAINKLVHKNLIIYANQSEFIENAAHELQTPLAIFKGQVDNLLQSEDLTESQADRLGNMLEASERLIKLNRNLLLLSKLDQQVLPTETLQLSEAVRKHAIFFSEQAESSGIAFRIECRGDREMEINPEMMEVVLNNLFNNAIRHNQKGGNIVVTLDSNFLQIANSGLPEKLDADLIFERFAKGRSGSVGSGLGLAIVEKIAAGRGWGLFYDYVDGMHCFRIVF